jgi:hypothetical protein
MIPKSYISRVLTKIWAYLKRYANPVAYDLPTLRTKRTTYQMAITPVIGLGFWEKRKAWT